MTTILRGLERDLLDEVGARLKRFGFSTQPKGQTFRKSFQHGRMGVHLAFIEHEDDFDVTVDVAVRFDAVENSLNRSSRLLTAREKAETFTLGVELGNLEHGEPFRLTVRNSGDIVPTADNIARKFETVGLPYLEQYSSPEAAYNLLSEDDREAWMHSPIHLQRAKRACMLLDVLDRKGEISQLGAKKLSFLQSVRDPGTAEFSKFLSEFQ